jgi:hypothetical protein
MPIRLNLLAEAQAAEESRRKDPVKRTIWVAALLVTLMLTWSSWLQFKGILAKKDLGRVEAEMKSHATEYNKVNEEQKKIEEIRQKLTALRQLSESRFLQASLLNALQQTNVDEVQLVHLKAEQTYAGNEGTKTKTNANCVIPGKPPSVTERILVTLEGSDCSINSGDQIGRYKDAVAGLPYFKDLLGKTNLVILKAQSQRQMLPVQSGGTPKEGVQFTLDCRALERTR